MAPLGNRSPEMPPYRPPSEAGSLLIRVTRGCAWNRCAFCGMYKETRFSIRTRAEIREDLAHWRADPATAEPDSLFLGDSDCLVHPELPAIVADIQAAFPRARRMTAYTRLHTLWRRPAGFLRAVREAGLNRVHAGLESGDPEVLARTHKGVDPERAIDGARNALAAGFELSLYVLSGLGGQERWEAHARESARVLAAALPHFLRLRSLVVLSGTPLAVESEAGAFTPVSPLTRLHETRLLIAELASAMERNAAALAHPELEIFSDHFSNYLWGDGDLIYGGVNGYLPGDRDLLLGELDEVIALAAGKKRLVDPASLAASGRAPGMYGGPAL